MSSNQPAAPTVERHETPDGLAVFVEDEESFEFYADLLPGADPWHVTWMYDKGDELGLIRVHEIPVDILDDGRARYWYTTPLVEAE